MAERESKKAIQGERSFRGLSPEQRTRERRAKLVVAATEEFATRGFHGTTVLSVCKAAGLTERYFYESFENLGALFQAVHGHAADLLRERTLTAIAAAPKEPMALAEAALNVYFQFLSEDIARARVLVVEPVSGRDSALRDAARARKTFASLLRGYVQFLFPWLSRADDPTRLDIVCSGLVGSTNYIAYDWVMEGCATPLPLVLESALILYRGLMLFAQSIQPAARESAEQAHVPRPRKTAKKKQG